MQQRENDSASQSVISEHSINGETNQSVPVAELAPVT
jgi:hypothetical protein